MKFVGAEKLFILVISASCMAGCMIWIIISLWHICFRKSLTQEQVAKLKFKAWAFPVIPYLSILFNTCVILGVLWDPDQRMVVYSGIALIGAFSVMYRIYYKR